MVHWYLIIFVVGIIAGVLYTCLSTKKERHQPPKFPDRLDDVDEMVLWGEVTNDPFYNGQ